MTTVEESRDFIRTAIDNHLADGKYNYVRTRFPPEPNGFLHIGHVKAICIDFGIAADFGGECNLRFDDTNPAAEEQAFVDAQLEDIRWLGFEPARVLYASDYFEQLYAWAVQLIKAGKAYVDDLSQEEMREYRGTLTEPGRNSPYRDRTVEENLDLLERMRRGEFPEGARVLRAKIDMASPNIMLRDPTMYRILHEAHQRTGTEWVIYPMYDWAHGQSDSIEGITHSLCSLEYENHRPLYEWFLENLGIFAPTQIEFARLNLEYTITSKRRLRRLVEDGHVAGWDDPRMPTIRAMRRRGYPPEALREFCDQIGIAKAHNVVSFAMLEYFVRDHLNRTTPRAMAVAEPLKLVIENYPADKVDQIELPNYPQDKSRTETRTVPFTRELYIERSDFAEIRPPKFRRLYPGGPEVRLLGAYYVKVSDVIKDEAGNVVEVRCTYDPESYGGTTPDGRKVRGTIHWVSAEHNARATLRLYDHLFTHPDPLGVSEGDEYLDLLNPDSLVEIPDAIVEPALAAAQPGDRFQFMRNAYFVVDPDSTADQVVFNRTVSLRDSYGR